MTIGEEVGSWKVGALAALTGLTVRALHHYDHIGLLRPSSRNRAGHRLYTTPDVTRLYRISLLRRLGFPLGQISQVLDDPDWDLPAAVALHLVDTRRRAVIAAALRDRLVAMSDQLARQAADGPSPTRCSGLSRR